MPVLVGVFSGLFSSIAGFFAMWLTKKAAFGAAAVASFAVLTIAFMAILATSINIALAVAAPPSWFIIGFRAFMPANFVACVSAIVAAYVAQALYRWNAENIRLLSYVT